MSRSGRFLLLVALTAAGCANKGGLRNDPFQPGAKKESAQAPPPANEGLSDPFLAGTKRAQERDSARDVSTSPATDPQKEPRPAESTAEPIDKRRVAERDPFLTPAEEPQRLAATGKGPPKDPGEPAFPNQFATQRDGQSAPKTDYQSIRKRLDQAGVKSVLLETDEKTGEKLFRCEVPHPSNPELLRVFEARDPDELKAMLAVTEKVEEWLAAPSSPR